jgi:hypothetical protein
MSQSAPRWRRCQEFGADEPIRLRSGLLFPPLPHQDTHDIGEMLVEGTGLVFVIQVRRKGDNAVS